MPRTIALASTYFKRMMFGNVPVRFIRHVLIVLSQEYKLPIAERCLVDQARKRGAIEQHLYSELSRGYRVSRPNKACRQVGPRLAAIGVAQDGTSGVPQAIAPLSSFDRYSG